jgi:hypothetical protein
MPFVSNKTLFQNSSMSTPSLNSKFAFESFSSLSVSLNICSVLICAYLCLQSYLL